MTGTNDVQTSLVPVRAVFAVFGVYFGAIAVSVADIEDALGISHSIFGFVLASALVAGACMSAVISVRAHRVGIGRTMRECLLFWSAISICAALTPPSWFMVPLFIAAVGAAGAVDVVMNTISTVAVKASPTGLLRIHAMYNLGCVFGAGGAGLLVVNDLDWRIVWLVAAVLAGALSRVDWTQYNTDAAADEDDVPLYAALASLVNERLVIVAAAFILGAVVEGGIDAWGPLYLRVDLEAGAAHGALAAAIGYLIGFCGRMSMSTLSTKWGAKRCVLLGTVICAFGLVLIVTSTNVVVAAIGLALAVGGITVNWPLLLSYATDKSANAALITGGLSSTGYVGLVLSPAVLGVVGGHFGLRTSLGVLTACALVVLLLISTMPRRRTRMS